MALALEFRSVPKVAQLFNGILWTCRLSHRLRVSIILGINNSHIIITRMQTDNTLVSIISPAYNSAKTIDATIRSVLAQTYPHWEMLIADDGSIDDTVARVKADDDSRIRLLINDKNMGPAATRNRTLAGGVVAVDEMNSS